MFITFFYRSFGAKKMYNLKDMQNKSSLKKNHIFVTKMIVEEKLQFEDLLYTTFMCE